jgi:amino-acid N-acetyltransferase
MTAVAAAFHPLQAVHGDHWRPGGTITIDSAAMVVRPGVAADVDGIHALIVRYRAAGQLLPRTRDEIAAHVDRFVVAVDQHGVVGCADLAPLSRSVAEVRSLVVDDRVQGAGLGRRLLTELVARASAGGYVQLCALTHSPAYFVRLGFSIVPHQWLPEKIETDCRTCAQFRRCEQHAVALPLVRKSNGGVTPAAIHG